MKKKFFRPRTLKQTDFDPEWYHTCRGAGRQFNNLYRWCQLIPNRHIGTCTMVQNRNKHSKNSHPIIHSAKNPDVSSGPQGCSIACLLALLTHLLAPHRDSRTRLDRHRCFSWSTGALSCHSGSVSNIIISSTPPSPRLIASASIGASHPQFLKHPPVLCWYDFHRKKTFFSKNTFY